MIDEEETYKRFGYYSTDWGLRSHKRIVVQCDDCGVIHEVDKSNYRPLCMSCCQKGKTEGAKHYNWQGGKTKRLCKICGATFYVKKCVVKMGKGNYCSAECRTEAQRGEKHPMWGKHHTIESKQKMSDSKKGTISPKRGIPLPEGQRRKLSKINIGRHHSKEAKRKIGEAERGEKHWNWQGGISFGKYCPKFNERFKEYIRNKFDRKCYLCGKTEDENGRKLDVHHVNYDKNCGCAETEEAKKADDNTCQFVPLCISCNSKVNNNRDKWEKHIKNKLRNKLNGWFI